MVNYLEDYTGKLNDHQSYLDMLKKLESQCVYIELVLIEKGALEENALIMKFYEDIEFVKKVSKWWGTKTSCKNNLVRIKASKELFRYLRTFETFCKYYYAKEYNKDFRFCEDVVEDTDFGYDDIAFYNKKNEILLCTTTHEGYISVHKKLIEN